MRVYEDMRGNEEWGECKIGLGVGIVRRGVWDVWCIVRDWDLIFGVWRCFRCRLRLERMEVELLRRGRSAQSRCVTARESN